MGKMDEKRLSTKFFITSKAADNAVLAFTLTELSQPANAEHLLKTYAAMIGTREIRVAAALFCSWYAGVCGAMHSLLAAQDPKADTLRLANMSIRLVSVEKIPVFSFHIHECRGALLQNKESEVELRSVLALFYRDEVRPIIASLSQAARVKEVWLWKQVYNELYAYMEEELTEASGEGNESIIRERFKRMTWDIEPEAFGLSINPFRHKQKFIIDPADSGRIMFVKAACCLAYRLEADFGYCCNCPISKS